MVTGATLAVACPALVTGNSVTSGRSVDIIVSRTFCVRSTTGDARAMGSVDRKRRSHPPPPSETARTPAFFPTRCPIIFGRVPFFFYILHFYVLGVGAAVVQTKFGLVGTYLVWLLPLVEWSGRVFGTTKKRDRPNLFTRYLWARPLNTQRHCRFVGADSRCQVLLRPQGTKCQRQHHYLLERSEP